MKRRRARLGGAAVLAGLAMAGGAGAQDDVVPAEEWIAPVSPVYSIGREEILRLQQSELERILHLLPFTQPADGQNLNIGSAGAATVDLRGLGAQRTLVLVDGKRLTPFSVHGVADTSIIPVALIERIEIGTGGGSVEHGSAAMAGTVNIVTRRDFEGAELAYRGGLTGEADGEMKASSLLLGGKFDEGRGSALLSIDWSEREGVEFGDRPLGQHAPFSCPPFTYATCVSTPPPPPSDCVGPNAVTAGGSGTTVPTRIIIPGAGTTYQFRNDRTLAGTCNVFNFFPYGYYQTPQERFGGTMLGHFGLTPRLEAYSRISYGVSSVTQATAPSGIFGVPLWTPMTNALIDPAVRAQIVNQAEANRAGGSTFIDAANWRDEDASGTVTPADDLLLRYFRRTVELGPRATEFENSNFQFVVGSQVLLTDAWTFDLSFARGQADRTQAYTGYTSLANIPQQVESEDGLTCAPGAASHCVPLDLFGGYGTITAQAAEYASATALVSESYEQRVTTGVLDGTLPLPFGERSMALRLGYETRREAGELQPDECLETAPASCLGGAGPALRPVAGAFRADEFFGEARLPLAALDLELGLRSSDFSTGGSATSWKHGLAWATGALRLHTLWHRSVRAPGIGEFAAPRTSAATNALMDPCSVANASFLNNGSPQAATLRARCESTGMTPAQVGTVPDLIAGQVTGFFGADPANPPDAEEGDGFTAGLAFAPDAIAPWRDLYLTVDYYEITVNGYVGAYSSQEVLDACYVQGRAGQCAGIVRVAGDLAQAGAGVELFNTNLDYRRVEGIELGAGGGFDLGGSGSLKLTALLNRTLAQETRRTPASSAYDCAGHYSPDCGGPNPEWRWVQRTTWVAERLETSLQWRHLGKTSAEPSVRSNYYAEFQTIREYDYLDLALAYTVSPGLRLHGALNNLFEQDPPAVTDDTGPVGTNAGNTFPSRYDPVGRVFVFGIQASF